MTKRRADCKVQVVKECSFAITWRFNRRFSFGTSYLPSKRLKIPQGKRGENHNLHGVPVQLVELGIANVDGSERDYILTTDETASVGNKTSTRSIAVE